MKIVLILMIILTFGMVSCNMNRDKNTESVTAGTDSSLMNRSETNTNQGTSTLPQDPGVVGNQPVAGAVDSTAAGTIHSVVTQKDNTIVDNTGVTKKAKKGKVSITSTALNPSSEMKEDKEGYYTNAEVLPAFPGGQKALDRFYEDNIKYPQEAVDNNIEGTVNISFLVDETGKVSAPKINNDKIGHGIETEALRVFNKMPKWTPGKIKGKNVKTRYTLPIKFQLF